jgi:hypothetical protein
VSKGAKLFEKFLLSSFLSGAILIALLHWARLAALTASP